VARTGGARRKDARLKLFDHVTHSTHVTRVRVGLQLKAASLAAAATTSTMRYRRAAASRSPAPS
jgi:hypothetical protein